MSALTGETRESTVVSDTPEQLKCSHTTREITSTSSNSTINTTSQDHQETITTPIFDYISPPNPAVEKRASGTDNELQRLAGAPVSNSAAISEPKLINECQESKDSNKIKLKSVQESVTLETFEFFPKLPPEIRLLVWSYALPGPRILTLKLIRLRKPVIRFIPGTGTEYPRERRHSAILKSIPRNPAMLHVNQESRNIGLKTYNVSFREEVDLPIYFSCQEDIILDSENNVKELLLDLSYHFPSTIRNLALAAPRTIVFARDTFLGATRMGYQDISRILRDSNVWNQDSLWFMSPVTQSKLQDNMLEAIVHIRGLQTITLVHEVWSQEYAQLSKEWFFGEIEGRGRYLSSIHGSGFELEGMPDIRHMSRSEFEETYK